MKLYVCDSGALPGTDQMEIDNWFGHQFNFIFPNENTLFLRLYEWNPPSISIGYHQKESDFNLEKLHADNISLIRRSTGGRAVYHVDELTYSVVCRTTKTNAEHYQEIHLALQAGFQKFGISTTFQKHQPDFRIRNTNVSGVTCFTASARYELEVNGKKMVGSAQRKFGDTLLQHGSIMLTPKHQDLVNYLLIHDEEIKYQLKKDLKERTISVSEILRISPSKASLKKAIIKGFETTYHAIAEEVSLLDLINKK